ncbi:hypothetical protein [Sulfurovum zhangzhouensis]|nr:hypothetical protein [Sulfurovum zhangzhouensis]
MIIITILLMFGVLFADEQKAHTHLSYDTSVTLLQDIQSDAIILGEGKKLVYVFVDPLCPHSRKFITMVSQSPEMLSKYRYCIFLYSIPRLKSTDVVSAVYMSPKPIDTLLQIMVEQKVSSTKGDEVTIAKVARIAKIANKMDVYKRPYLIIKK